MKHITSTALAAGAQESCAAPDAPLLPGMGSIARQPAFPPVLRRDLMAAVNTCARDLGLRPASVVVLDALLSCLPCHDRDGRDTAVTPATLLTVYASNETLCFRARGLSDRQLRRHLELLEKAGLLHRRDSANGKRFPVMRGGRAIGAFGLDLAPLFARAPDLLALALRRRDEAAELRGLRAQILQFRAICLTLPLEAQLIPLIENLRNLMRRATLTLVEARATLAQLTGIIADSSGHSAGTQDPRPDNAPPAEPQTAGVPVPAAPVTVAPGETPACDGQNVRHKQSESETKKTFPGQGKGRWSDLSELAAFYEQPRHLGDCRNIAYAFGKMLGIDQRLLTLAESRLGLWDLLCLENHMARAAIDRPASYLRSVLGMRDAPAAFKARHGATSAYFPAASSHAA